MRFFSEHDNAWVWLNLIDLPRAKREFLWKGYEAPSYPLWGPDLADNATGEDRPDEDCTSFGPNWNDISCQKSKMSPLCEAPAKSDEDGNGM